jgi:hypothetical protein
MKNAVLALSLAMALSPLAAMADDTTPVAPPAPPRMSQTQRQAMFKTLQAFRQKEDALHQQLRSQVLSSLSAAHRTAVAGVIGQLAISASPDPSAAAKQLDAVLSQSEQQHILAAHTAFAAQSKALHDQLRAQMRSAMPAGGPAGDMHGAGAMQGSARMAGHAPATFDAGTLLLMILGKHEGMKGMMGHHFGAPGGPPAP